jgi:hypothetical protein
MFASTALQFRKSSLSEERQVKALLRLVEDLGYEVDTSPAGDWTVSAVSDLGDQTVISFDSAREVVAAARALAESLCFDMSLAPSAS